MGDGFCKNKQGLILLSLFYFLFFSVPDIYASFGEFELFDRAYENYLFYKPEEAVKDFKIFLQEFPDSSAKDAAMFWLAKSLIQMKSFEEARKIFSDIKQQFPESPFKSYVDKELENLEKLNPEAHKKPVGSHALNEGDTSEIQFEELKKKMDLLEKALKEVLEERDKLKEELGVQRKKGEELQQMLDELKEKESKKAEEIDTLKLQLEQERKNAEDLQAKIREYEENELKKQK